MAVTTATFWQALKGSNLLSSKRLAQVRAAAEKAGLLDKPAELAQALVKKSLLTQWQAQQLLAGQKAFFLGKYKLLDRLGSGGMGSVFKAVDTKLGRHVALKVVANDRLKKSSALARFRREIQAAASLQHANIIASVDADRVGNTHFLVMEYVEGRDLNRIAKKQGPLDLAFACEVIRQAALGLQHAHEMGMVHRDIKPANLLVTKDRDGRPLVKLLDMGLARFISDERTDSDITETGQILGTPDYIAPEQAKNTRKADIRADIFSLGCTMYRIIAGRLPFEGENPVEKLVARYTTSAPPIRTYREEVPPSLEAIIAKMLAQDPAKRFQTPAEVAQALAPFALQLAEAAGATAAEAATPSEAPRLMPPPIPPVLEQALVAEPAEEPSDDSDTHEFLHLLAHQIGESSTDGSAENETLAEAVRSVSWDSEQVPDRSQWPTAWARRWDVWVLAGVAAVLLALVGSVGWRQLRETELEIVWPTPLRDNARLYVDGEAYDLSQADRLVFSGPPGTRLVRIERDGYEPIEESIELPWGESRVFRPEFIKTGAVRRAERFARIRDVMTRVLTRPPQRESLRMYQELQKSLQEFVAKWPQSEEGREANNFLVSLQNHLAALQSNPPAASPFDRLNPQQLPAELQPLAERIPLVGVFGDLRFTHMSPVNALAYSPDGQWLASGSLDREIKIWNAQTGAAVKRLQGAANLYELRFSSDGRFLASLGYQAASSQGLYVWRTSDFSQLKLDAGPSEQVLSLAFWQAPGSKASLVTGHLDGSLRIWDLSTRKVRGTINAHAHSAMNVGTSPDGKHLASLGSDGIKLWDLSKPQLPKQPRLTLEQFARQRRSGRGGFTPWSLAFSPDGRRLATLGHDRKVKFWKVSDGTLLYPVQSRNYLSLQNVEFSPDGDTVALYGRGSAPVILWDVEKRRTQREISTGHSYSSAVAFHPRGNLLAVAEGPRIRVVDPATGQDAFTVGGHSGAISSVAYHHRDNLLMSLGREGELILWDPATGRSQGRFAFPGGTVAAASFTPSGEKCLVASQQGPLFLGEIESGRVIFRPLDLPRPNGDVAISPDGNQAALLINQPGDVKVIVQSLPGGQQLQTLTLPRGIASAVQFSPDGSQLAVRQRQRAGATLHFWNTDTWQKQQLPPQRLAVTAFAFSPDGEKLFSSVSAQRAVFWDVRQEQPIREVSLGSPTWLTEALFSPTNSDRLVTLDGQGTIQLWNASRGRVVGRYDLPWGRSAGFLGRASRDLAFGPAGRHLAVAQPNGALFVLRLGDDGSP